MNFKEIIKNKYLIHLLILLAFLAGIGFEWIIQNFSNFGEVTFQKIHPLEANYKFINPLLGVEIAGGKESSEYLNLSKEIKKYVASQISSKKLDKVSVYFLELEKGRWIGIEENEDFNAASLFKVPIALAYYKQADKDPTLLSKTIYVNDTEIISKALEAKESVTKPGNYTVNQLIDNMIIYSDNTAANILLTAAKSNLSNFGIDYESFKNVFTYLGVFKNESGETLTISPRLYSLFFRVLYNSTFLSRDMSEKALNLLSKTTYNDGLVAGIPNNVKVSHKFGYHIDSESNKNELHDCGIIYHESQPYFLCIMTRGDNLVDLKQVIKNISQIAFEYVGK